MGWFSRIKKIGKKGFRLAKGLRKMPGLKLVPGLGTALIAADVGFSAYNALNGKTKTGPPAPSMMSSSRRRPLMISPGQTGGGLVPRGPGGGMQAPWHDPSTPAGLKPYALDDSYLKTYYRAPHGYVVVRDAKGRPYPLLKTIARQSGLWKPAKKPPISVRDYQALKRADKTVRRIKKVNVMAKRIANFGSTKRKSC